MEIRPYEAGDRDACRSLWVQLVEHHREIYDDPSIGGGDPGGHFEEYLALPDRVISWVAVEGDKVIGLTGLLWEGDESTIEPVIVDRDHRGTGVGRALVETAVDESRHRGAVYVSLKPVARNASAIQAFHQLGFRTLGHLELFLDLKGDDDAWQSGIEVHGRSFEF